MLPYITKGLFAGLLMASLSLPAFSQILDDSTKLVYGPTTINYSLESSLYYLTNQVYFPDTAVTYFYRNLPVEQSGYQWQELDNTGTALAPVFYHIPSTIGARNGYNAYAYWFTSPEKVRYYNTRSPYTRLHYSQGGNGRSWLQVTHARNINKNWSAAFDFNRLTAEPQYGAFGGQDKQVVSTSYMLNTRYYSPNDRYKLLAHVSRLHHEADELGGIFFNQELPSNLENIIEYQESTSQRTTAYSEDLRVNYHLYQEYKLVNALQIYGRADKEHQINYFEDTAPTQEYYNQQLPEDLTRIYERLRTDRFEGQGGFKGELKAGKWNAYAKYRRLTFTPRRSALIIDNEYGLGGFIALIPDTARALRVEAELYTEGMYKFTAEAKNKFLQLKYQRARYKPALIYNFNEGQLNNWVNNFTYPQADRLEGRLELKLGSFSLEPGVTFSLVQDPLYFSADSISLTTYPQNIRPRQASGSVQLVQPKLAWRWQTRKATEKGGFHWDTDITYSLVTGEAKEAWPAPEFIINSAFYYEGGMFGGNLRGQVGIDAHLTSVYYARAYAPAIQQFAVQETYQPPAYPIANIFFGFRINNTRVFARLSHFNQGFTDEGYFLTPYYPGIGRSFDIGIDWLFFD